MLTFEWTYDTLIHSLNNAFQYIFYLSNSVICFTNYNFLEKSAQK